MIYSVGIDLIELERVSNALDKWGDKFARRILGEEERILYREKKNKVQFLAGRFAAKEAVMKSLGTFFDSGVHLRDIQVLNDLYGKPYTHERKMAAAVAIVTGD